MDFVQLFIFIMCASIWFLGVTFFNVLADQLDHALRNYMIGIIILVAILVGYIYLNPSSFKSKDIKLIYRMQPQYDIVDQLEKLNQNQEKSMNILEKIEKKIGGK